jgi:hypothetical protein
MRSGTSKESAEMKIFSFFDRENTCSPEETQGVTILTGDPKKAIISLSGPMIIAMLLMSSYTIVNAVWVVGLGSDALAAVGFMTPLYMVLIGLGTGIGAGDCWHLSGRGYTCQSWRSWGALRSGKTRLKHDAGPGTRSC